MGAKDRQIAELEAKVARRGETIAGLRSATATLRIVVANLQDDLDFCQTELVAVRAELAACQEPPPEPEPEPESPFADLTVRPWRPTSRDDWSQALIEDGSIIDLPDGVVEFKVPGGGKTDQRRCELQAHRDSDGGSDIPGEIAYEYELLIPPSSVLPTSRADGWTSISQKHTNQPCFTGAFQIHKDGYLGVTVKGGKTSNFSGSCDQAYEEDFILSDPITYGRWFLIQERYRWHESDGSCEIWIDGTQRLDLHGVPTCGVHNDPQHPATRQKFRLGPYGFVYPGEFTMQIRNVRVYAGFTAGLDFARAALTEQEDE